jgi:hypothetical protein
LELAQGLFGIFHSSKHISIGRSRMAIKI